MELLKRFGPPVEFATIPASPHEDFRVAAKLVYDPSKGRVRNLLENIIGRGHVFLGKSTILEKAMEEARNLGSQVMDDRGRRWEIVVHQMDMLADWPTIRDEIGRVAEENAKMEKGIAILRRL